MSLRSAYDAGLRAARSDYPSIRNPYKKRRQFLLRWLWNEGWYSGISDSMREWLKKKKG